MVTVKNISGYFYWVYAGFCGRFIGGCKKWLLDQSKLKQWVSQELN
jgi:hypothetical protein